MQTLITDSKVLIGLGILYMAFCFGSGFGFIDASLPKPDIVIGTLFVYSFFLGLRRYGLKSILIFVGLTFSISWTLETTSINTGFPFGHYYYSDLLGPKIGLVPIIIMPAYFSVGFLAWSLSHVMLKNLGSEITKNNLIISPVIAAFIMVMWDFSMDPSTSTLEGLWIWENGGSYFGVPIKNFVGWFFTVYLIFQSFALYLFLLQKNGRATSAGKPLTRMYWYLTVVGYIGIAIPIVMIPLHNPHEGQSEAAVIHQSLALAATMTMIFVSILSLVLISRMKKA